MATLSEQIDRLSRNAKSIKSIVAKIGILDNGNRARTRIAGPFAHAVLYKPLGDLIRDVDPSELGLFNLVSPSGSAHRANEKDARGAVNPEISRVEFPGATPLRQPARRDDTQKSKELEPEVFAQAALKYLDRYEPIRPMPRAHAQVASIIEQIAAVRDSVNMLSDALHETMSANDHISLKDRADDEECRVKEMQSRILELKQRKEAALKQCQGLGAKFPRSSRAISQQKLKRKLSSPPSSASKHDAREDAFWNTPAATARTLRFDNLLSDELSDLGNVSMSFASPMPQARAVTNGPSQAVEPLASTLEESPHNCYNIVSDIELETHGGGQELEREEVDCEDQDEKTIVLNKTPPYTPEAAPSSPPVAPGNEVESPTPGPAYARPKKFKIKVNSEVERIVAKIWATVGEIIMPGNPFTLSESGNTPPRAKETIAHLHSISSQTPASSSPSVSSESSLSTVARGPTTQQVLTAHLLLTLLSSAHFSLSLNKVKEELASKAGGTAAALGVGSTRVLYGCVAKRLVKIERGGGEQVVKFDI